MGLFRRIVKIEDSPPCPVRSQRSRISSGRPEGRTPRASRSRRTPRTSNSRSDAPALVHSRHHRQGEGRQTEAILAARSQREGAQVNNERYEFASPVKEYPSEITACLT